MHQSKLGAGSQEALLVEHREQDVACRSALA